VSLCEWLPTFRSNVGNHSPNDTASHPRRPEPSATPLQKYQILNAASLFRVLSGHIEMREEKARVPLGKVKIPTGQ
jgi:hypothetical protein